MTYHQIYKKSVSMLEECGNPSADFEVRTLMECFFKIGRISFLSSGNQNANPTKENDFFSALKERISGYPLQYILRQWSFMDCEFSVGEGVLIPRDDTEVCVRECINIIQKSGKQKPIIIDLCSGNGAIAVSLAKKFPDSCIFALELSETAFGYLKENIKINGCTNNIISTNGDIFRCFEDFHDGFFDIIISNPPYIKTEELPYLQKEVTFEPKMALDGGADGLKFYRCIAENWFSKLKDGGSVVLEIGENQGNDVSDIFRKCGGKNINVINDIQNLERTVTVLK